MNIRARIIVRGKVQKGGYRYLVNEAAFANGLTGLVGNRDDGTVEIVCEGRKEAIQRFERSIRIRDPMTHVLSMHVRYLPATGEFKYFDIVPEPDPARATLERADAAASALRAMDSHITAMDRNIGRRFDRLDRSYGSFGRTLKAVSRDMRGARSSAARVASNIGSLRNAVAPSRSRKRASTA